MIFRRIWYKVRDWKFDRRMAKQRRKRGFADCDCWGMDYWFCDTFVKMIRTLRDMKHGAPEREFEEFDTFPLAWVNEKAKILLEKKNEQGWEDEGLDFWGDEKYFDRWWMVLERIAWCLEQSGKWFEEEGNPDLINEYRDEHMKQFWGEKDEKESFDDWWNKNWEIDKVDNKGKPLTYKLKEKEVDKTLEKNYFRREMEISQYKEKCKDEAFDLLKKYFYHLWD